ncbi:MAG: serpin family protein [Verrucomicrobia bacterium]|nr:MAG: serpin family protein [Verrucomicrobiota bacterium]
MDDHRKGRVLAISSLILSLFEFGAHGAPPVEDNNAFAFDLYAQLKDQPGNLFFSPYSISTCLAMAYAGARGETEKQMAQVLHFDSDQKRLHSGFAALQKQLAEAEKVKGIELNIANGLWAQKGHPFLTDYLNVARDEYKAQIEQADFMKNAESIRQEINHWVERKTKEKIKDIVPAGALNDMTRLVLANAIYFKGAWRQPFPKSMTEPQPFHLSPERQVEVPLMHHFDVVRYFEDDNMQGVEMPYLGNQLSMAVLLPRKVDGCAELESRLSAGSLAGWLGQMKSHKVEIFFPRFKLESEISLSRVLGKMGMRNAFTPTADFSGMDGRRELFISAVLHKAWGDINEEGTEAAAATVAVATASAALPAPPPPVFRADHPFVFLIRDSRSGGILFLGRFSNPSP